MRSKRLRVSLLCAGNRVFGLEIMALTLARGLRARGHEVSVVVSGWTDGEFERRLHAAAIPYQKAYFGKISKSLRPKHVRWTLDALRHLPGARRALSQHLCAFKPDVVIAYNRDWVILAAGILRKESTIFHAHELPVRSRASRIIYRQLSKSSRTFVAASEHVAERLRQLGVPAGQTAVIYNGLEAADGEQSVESRRGSTPTIGIIGQVAPWKGYDDLVEALALLRKSGRSFRCLAFGDGDARYLEVLKKKAQRLGVDDSISWHGYVSNPAEAFREMDICVVPSRVEEAFGLVAVEAALFRIPVVATRSGALSEIVIDGKTGFLTESGNAKALATSLDRLVVDAELRMRLGDAACRSAKERFSASRMIEGFEVLCARISSS